MRRVQQKIQTGRRCPEGGESEMVAESVRFSEHGAWTGAGGGSGGNIVTVSERELPTDC